VFFNKKTLFASIFFLLLYICRFQAIITPFFTISEGVAAPSKLPLPDLQTYCYKTGKFFLLPHGKRHFEGVKTKKTV
jgi:hypothetical protein